jgi:hypothetical protein
LSENAPGPVHLDAVLDGLAENPALPVELIHRLVTYRRGFGGVAKRADLTADVIDEIIATDYHWLLHSLALNPRLPNAVRLRLAEHHDPAVRAALVIGSRDNAPARMFAQLIDDPDTRVREYLAVSDHVPANLRARLAHDPAPQVRATLAQWWTLAPETVRRMLLTDPADQVRAAACATYYRRLPHPIPPADLIAGLIDDPVTRAGAVAHLTLTGEIARRLSEDPDDEVRRQVAQHPQLPPDVRERLGDDASARVRVAIFGRPDTPEPTRARIYAEILQPTAPLTDLLGCDLDDEVFLRKVEDSIATTELRNLDLPWVSVDPLPHVSSPYTCFRSSAAHASSLPAPVVIRLLNDDESIVRTTMARHAAHLVDHATAERIDRDFRPDKKTNWRPADDFTFPPQTLRRFANDPDPRMRSLAPRDPDLPSNLAEQLATDPENSVRHSIARHPRLPTPALITLLADPSEHVARAAATSPSLPQAHMDRLLTLAGV